LAREIAQSIDDKLVTLEIYERSGHGAFRDEPEPVLGRIREFVSGL
jgi:pimeloyl-ACP methyl ester carboxylesterase